MDALLNDSRFWAFVIAGLSALILGTVGLGILLAGVYWRVRAARSQQWPSAAGTVLASGVERYGTDSGDYYVPKINYRYIVNGQTYSSNKVKFGAASPFDRTSLQSVQTRYPVGQNVPVYYNPGNPTDAVLERRENASRGYFIVAVIVLLLALCVPPAMAIFGLSAMGQ